jgi:hypothetical protein
VELRFLKDQATSPVGNRERNALFHNRRLLTQIDWRLIFFVNLPVGAATLALLSHVALSPRRPAPFDWIGQISAVTGPPPSGHASS